MNQNQPPTRCSRCGAELPPHLPSGLCPKCLLEAGLGTQPQTGPGETVALSQSPALRGIPQPGEQFGHYRLARLLGQGGMGVVFEAEDLENGRRVALKILSQALDSPEARKRFLREGQIAASINHPNSVYVFGTEEIAGTPVIAMELVGGGTLRDRVVASGPLPATEAVDAILQIIAGLEAAQQAGVLHRDIKPSNCFMDPDGTIKIGDFGLSITTAVRTESNLTGAGSLFGTPAYSSVEQLRGEELTVRSDIYSVGVTLYYLLTGRLPFEAPNIVQLLVKVLEQRPQSPASLRAGIPGGLARAALHCLNKDPGARFQSYAALRRALLPYASSSPSPATLPLRFAAWIVDNFVISVPGWVLVFTFFGGPSFMTSPGHGGEKTLYSAVFSLLMVCYFGLFEGLAGASPGKALCRLRVVGLDGHTPGISKALARFLIFYGFSGLPVLALTLLSPYWITQYAGDPKGGLALGGLALVLPSAVQILMFLLLFCTCRRRNGFAGLHDLWSRTRVVSRSVQPIRPVLPPAQETPPAAGERPQIGPYHVLGELGRSGEAELFLGYDARLLRKVWLRKAAPGTPPIAPALCHLARPGRLRWLNGKRSDEDCWDAYEASAGQPLLNLVSTKQDWEKVRFWLLDLAGELKAGEKDGSLPAVLGLDRVWIASDGRAKLLDFPAPGSNSPRAVEPPQPASAQEFLRQAGLSALEGRAMSVEQARASSLALPLPLYARGFFQRLETAKDAGQLWEQLKAQAGKVATITRRRRLAMLAIALSFPLLTAVVMVLGSVMMRSKDTSEIAALQVCLAQVKSLGPAGTNSPGQPPAADEKRRQLEIYLAGRFGPIITNSVEWNGYLANALITPQQKVVAEQIVAAHPKISPAEFAEGGTAVKSQFPMIPAAIQGPSVFEGIPWMLPIVLYGSMLVYVIIPSLAGALFFRGGLAIHLLGIAVVGRDGRPSRLRALRRAMVAWLPLLLSPMLVMAARIVVGANYGLPAALSVLGLATLLSLSLRRSLQDRLAGTYLVPKGASYDTEPALNGPNHRWRLPLRIAGAVVLVVLVVVVVRVVRAVADLQKLSAQASTGASAARESNAVKACVVVLPNGTVAVDASIWVGTEKNASLNSFRPDEYTPRGMQRLQAHPLGEYNLPAVPGDMPVIVTHPKGLLVTTVAKAREDPRLRLRPFGRVEGILLSEGKPKPGGNLDFQLLTETPGQGLYLSRSATADQDGKFVLTNLPAGEYQIYRVFFPRRRMDEPTPVRPSHQGTLTVKEGETVQLQFGGNGRTVLGQAAPENPSIAVDWLNDSQSLELVRSSTAGGLSKFISESFGLGESAAEEMKNAREDRSYHLEFEEDGSFRAEDVPPGNYELRIKVTKPGPPGRERYLHEGELLGSLARKVTIPEGKEPFDLGRQIVAVKGEPAGAPVLPLDANLTTIEGRALQLASFRGKFVVLVFWTSWSEPSRKMLADLRAVRDEFARDSNLEFIAASLDDDADSLRQAAASGNSGFKLGRLAVGDRASVAEAFDITTLPAVFLLGPDGRIIARDLEAERLRTALRRALPRP
jgi:hypothetical protein